MNRTNSSNGSNPVCIFRLDGQEQSEGIDEEDEEGVIKTEYLPNHPGKSIEYNFTEETYQLYTTYKLKTERSLWGPKCKKLYSPKASAEAPYVFKEGTRTLDINMEPNIYSDILFKMGYIFFRINNNRLRASSLEVQANIIAGLAIAYVDTWWVFEEKELPYQNKKCLQFVLMEQKTGRFAAVLFAKLHKKRQWIEIESLEVQEDLQGRNLGSMLCALSINYYMTQGIFLFGLCSSIAGEETYLKLGFIKDHSTLPELISEEMVFNEESIKSVMVLNLEKNLQTFTSRKNQLKAQPFIGAMGKGNLEIARQLLPGLDKIVAEYGAQRFPLYNPNPDLLDRLNLRELLTLQRNLNHQAHVEAVARRAKGGFPLGASFWFDELQRGLDLLQKAKECLDKAKNLIPYRISASYTRTSSSKGIHPSSFRVRDTDVYDLGQSKLAEELSTLRVSLKLFNESFLKLGETEQSSFLEGLREPRFLIQDIDHLLDLLRKFLPIVDAPPGTVFSYIQGSIEKKFMKMSQHCFFHEICA